MLIASFCTSCSKKTETLAIEDPLAAQALEHSLSGQSALALAEAQRAITNGSKSANAYCGSALAHLEFGHTDEALEDASRACELRPDWALALDTKAICLLQQGKIAQAEALVTKAIQLQPDDERFHLHRAEMRNGLKETNQAHKDIQKLFSLGKLRGEALAERAYMLDLEAKWQEAESSASESIDILSKRFAQNKQNKTDSQLHLRKYLSRAYATRAWARNGQAKFYESLKDADEALKLSEGSFDARSARAWAASNLGMWSLAANDAALLIGQDPDAGHAYICRAWGRVGSGRAASAIGDAKHAKDLEPTNASANVVHAAALCGTGKLDAAMSECNIAIEKRQDYVRAHLIRSRIMRARNDLDGSLKEIGLCIAPGAPAFYYLERANLQEQRRQPDLALQDLTMAIKIEPNTPSFYEARAALLLKMNRKHEAQSDLANAKSLGVASYSSQNYNQPLDQYSAQTPGATIKEK